MILCLLFYTYSILFYLREMSSVYMMTVPHIVCGCNEYKNTFFTTNVECRYIIKKIFLFQIKDNNAFVFLFLNIY